jgi:serine/threonine protein kinase
MSDSTLPPRAGAEPSSDGTRSLLTLLWDEQGQRWRAGERVLVEALIERFSQLSDNRPAVLDLINHEIFLREQGGEKPQLDEYLKRFPDLADQLRLHFDVHGATAPGAPGSTSHLREKSRPAAAGDPVPPAEVAGYEILGELGRGGQAVVWKARDPRLQCLVALKQVLPGAADPAQRQRFEAEAQVIAALAHPHIVRVLAAGEERGLPWFAMEYVEGGSLERRVGRIPQEPLASARLLLLLARAVHAAHRAGVVHRDLKPGNVLLAPPADEPALNCAWGCPKISDFGLARRLSTAADLTRTGSILGTLGYMAPEQAGGSEAAGPAADVYALGAILYRLLTGRVPFRGNDLFAVLDELRSQPPEPPSRLAPGIPADLEAVCLKCLAKRPEDRFVPAAELAAALEAVLGTKGAPPKVSPPPSSPSPSTPLPQGGERGRMGSRFPGPGRGRRLALPGALGVLVTLAAVGVAWRAGQGEQGKPPGPGGAREAPASAGKPEAKMTVRVRHAGGTRWQSIDQLGVLPLRPDDEVRVEVKLSRPAFSYLLLLSSEGGVVPLYPWNDNDRARLEVKDVARPPPERKEAAWASPRAGGPGWQLNDHPGLETLLLLVRDEPLPAGVELRKRIGEVPKAKLRHPGEAALLELDRGRMELSSLLALERGFRDEAREVDEPLRALMGRLRELFPTQQAARFAHVAE